MFLILDEWVVHDLQNDNGKDRQIETVQFLEKVGRKYDKLVVVRDSKFLKKIWNFFSSISGSNVEFRGKVRLVKSLIQDTEKTEFIESKILKNGNQINNRFLSQVNEDDHYLALAYFHFKNIEETIIITTDKKLKETLEQNGVSIRFRDEFLINY